MTAPALLTTKQVADTLGLTVQRVNALARARGLGTLLTPQMRVFTEDDVAAMRDRPIGRPKRAGGKDHNHDR